MSRYATSGSNVAMALINTSLQRGMSGAGEDGCKTNHDYTAACANRFQASSLLEQTLRSLAADGTDEEKAEVDQFLAKGRKELQKVALHNVELERKQEAFKAASLSLKQQILAESDQENAPENTNYGTLFNEAMEVEYAKLKESKPADEYESYQKVCEELGISVNRSAKDDEDIEVVGNQGGDTQGGSQGIPRCAITQAEMNEPLKNKVCSHTFSRQGIEDVIRSKSGSRNCECPMAGCQNINMTMDQFVKDTQMELQINRARRRQQAEKEKLSQVAADLVDSDEE